MKNKLLIGTLGLLMTFGTGATAFAATSASDIVTRMDGIQGRIGTIVEHFSSLVDRLDTAGRDVSSLRAKLATVNADREIAKTQMQEFKAAYAAADNTMTAEVRKEGMEARNALKTFLTDVKGLRDMVMSLVGSERPEPKAVGNVSGTPVSNIPAGIGNAQSAIQ